MTAIQHPFQVRMTVARNIKRLRVRAGMSQERLARRAGIDRKTVNRIENGHFSPSLDTLARIARTQKQHPTTYFKGAK